MTEAEADRIEELFLAGIGQRAISREVGWSTTSIRSVLQNRGHTTQTRNFIDNTHMLALFDEGLSPAQIGERMGHSARVIRGALKRHGKTFEFQCPPSMPTVRRFLLGVGEPDEKGCIPWTRGTSPSSVGPYGIFYPQGCRKPMYAHRYALERKLGRELEPGEVARHTCDNPICVNPDHLLPGTQRDNVDDMMRRGRHCSHKKT